MPTTIQTIEHFICYGRNEVAQIMSLNGPDNAPQDIGEFRKLLLAALIDGYSRYAFPHAKVNRSRFLAFVRQYGGWADFDRVSLTHLAALLRGFPQSEFQNLRADVRARVSAWRNGSIVELSEDPLMTEITGRWLHGKVLKEPVSKVTIDGLSHGALLYAYRCSLAHELQPPGFSVDLMSRESPYYISGGDNLGNTWRERWLLVYPLLFFRNLALTCLSNFERQLKADGIDPYQLRGSGEFWLDSLNTE